MIAYLFTLCACILYSFFLQRERERERERLRYRERERERERERARAMDKWYILHEANTALLFCFECCFRRLNEWKQIHLPKKELNFFLCLVQVGVFTIETTKF